MSEQAQDREVICEVVGEMTGGPNEPLILAIFQYISSPGYVIETVDDLDF